MNTNCESVVLIQLETIEGDLNAVSAAYANSKLIELKISIMYLSGVKLNAV